MEHIKTIERNCPHCNSNARNTYAKGFDYEYRTCENEFFFARCLDCGLVYLNPIPAPEILDKVYPPHYKPFHFNVEKTNIILYVRNILEKHKASFYKHLLPENSHILDVGCGDGRYLNILKQVGSPNWELDGIDFAETAVNRARKRGLNVTYGKYETSNLGESQYDLIILNQVIEHFIDPSSMVHKLNKELKIGGYLNIETPCLDGWDSYLFKRSFWGGYHFPRHMVLFNDKTIKKFLESCGFEIVHIRYLLSPVFWVFSWHHLLESRVGIGAQFFSDNNPIALAAGTTLDVIQRIVRIKTSNMQVLARKKG